MQDILMIDARVVEDHVTHGIACYAYEVIKDLIENHSDNKNNFLILIHKNSCLQKLTLPKNIQLEIMKTSWISLLGQLELLKKIKKFKPKLFYSPSFVVPLFNCVKLIATLHDMNHVALAQNYSFVQKIYYFFLKLRLQKNSAVVTVSNFSKSEIIKYLNIPPEKIHVAHNGISDIFKSKKYYAENEFYELQKKYNLPGRYVFAVGNNKSYKNIQALIQAYCAENFSIPLVILGYTDNNSQLSSNQKDSAAQNNKPNVIFLPCVEDQSQLAKIYAYCKLFIFPSFYEGFGLPPLEACACGAPVLTSNVSSMPEILQNHVYYFDPHSINDMQSKIREVLNLKEDEVKNKVEKAEQFAKQYQWKVVTKKLLEIMNSFQT